MSVCKRVFSVGFGPGLDSMSPARSWRSPSHAAGLHGWFPKKWGPGPQERQDKVDTICTVPLDCGTPTTRRLYPFGAIYPPRQVHSCSVESRDQMAGEVNRIYLKIQ